MQPIHRRQVPQQARCDAFRANDGHPRREAAEVRTRSDVLLPQAGDLRQPQPGLLGEQAQSMITAADSRAPMRQRQQRLDFASAKGVDYPAGGKYTTPLY